MYSSPLSETSSIKTSDVEHFPICHHHNITPLLFTSVFSPLGFRSHQLYPSSTYKLTPFFLAAVSLAPLVSASIVLVPRSLPDNYYNGSVYGIGCYKDDNAFYGVRGLPVPSVTHTPRTT